MTVACQIPMRSDGESGMHSGSTLICTQARQSEASGGSAVMGIEFETETEGPRDFLADLAAIGPFFSVRAHLPRERRQLPWLTVSELASVPEPMRHRIAAVRDALAASAGSRAEQVDARVAASVAHFGVVARLVSPALAALALGYQLSMDPSELWWQDVLGGPFPLSVPVPAHRLDGGTHRSPEEACQELVVEVTGPVTSVVAKLVPVSSRVLWGNVASAVNSASMQIAAKRPATAGAAQRAAEIIFDAPQLRTERNHPGPGFRRASCCLIYRLSADRAKGTCGDCVLRGLPS
jgi:ferric iron reductase protein FhuF